MRGYYIQHALTKIILAVLNVTIEHSKIILSKFILAAALQIFPFQN